MLAPFPSSRNRPTLGQFDLRGLCSSRRLGQVSILTTLPIDPEGPAAASKGAPQPAHLKTRYNPTMPDPDSNPHGLTTHRTRCRWQAIATFACLLLVGYSGCGLQVTASRSSALLETIQGKDSAGATIELERHGDNLRRARVVDVVLGAAEAEIHSAASGAVEFTVAFPGGASITYQGQRSVAGASEGLMISGTWHQHADGLFAADSGIWEASATVNDSP